MQYVLTEEEYDALQNAVKHEKQRLQDTLENLCTRVADHEPVDWGWGDGEPPKPWGCVYTSDGEWYCDSCPVQKVCPRPKHWSK